jgi:PadR family transcriptional regulator, regulatory protein PadR
MENEIDVLRGTLDLMILKALSWVPMHGLGVLRWIEHVSGRRLQIEEAALYPALHRLEKKGLLAARWGVTERNREAKFYRLTPAGRRALAGEISRWRRYTETLDLVLAAAGPEVE